MRRTRAIPQPSGYCSTFVDTFGLQRTVFESKRRETVPVALGPRTSLAGDRRRRSRIAPRIGRHPPRRSHMLPRARLKFLSPPATRSNLLSLVGVILLMGIVAKDAILLIDFAKWAREKDGLPGRGR